MFPSQLFMRKWETYALVAKQLSLLGKESRWQPTTVSVTSIEVSENYRNRVAQWAMVYPKHTSYGNSIPLPHSALFSSLREVVGTGQQVIPYLPPVYSYIHQTHMIPISSLSTSSWPVLIVMLVLLHWIRKLTNCNCKCSTDHFFTWIYFADTVRSKHVQWRLCNLFADPNGTQIRLLIAYCNHYNIHNSESY